MFRKTVAIGLVFLIFTNSISTALADESDSFSRRTEAAVAADSPTNQKTDISTTPEILSPINKTQSPISETQPPVPEVQPPAGEIHPPTPEPPPPAANPENSATIENQPPPTNTETPPPAIFNAIKKNIEDRKPLEGNNFKLQADTATGALTMNYQIQVPPGRNGMQPDLVVSYNSQNTDNENLFGYGWSINIPSIERLNKNGTDKLYSENYFTTSFSGELASTSLTDETHGSYGAKIENENFLKYEYKNDNSWEASDKSGLTYKFGQTAQSRQDDPNNNTRIFKWMLEEVRDTNDNIKLLKTITPENPPPIQPPTDEIFYENAEDGKTLGWKAYSKTSSIINSYENEKQGKVILLKSPLNYGGFELRKDDGKNWDNVTHKFFSFDLNSKNDLNLELIIETDKGAKRLSYSSLISKSMISGDYIFIKLESSLLDGKWHTITRDLQADISSIAPGITLNKINYLQLYWYGSYLMKADHIKLDNIKLMKSMPGSIKPPPATPPAPPTVPPTGPSIQTIYHHTDHLSGTSIETDENGNVIEMTDYYPFGEIRIDQSFTSTAGGSINASGTPATPSAGTSTSTGYKNPYKFTGKELDTDIGLYYYGARYYNPAIGRFISMDPWEGDLKDPQSLNKYSYVLNNPLKYVDENGEFAVAAIPWVASGAEWLAGAIAVVVGAYIVSTDPEIPAIIDKRPPINVSEPLSTPNEGVKGIINTTLPANEIQGPNLTTIPKTEKSTSIESIPAKVGEKGMNVMLQKNKHKHNKNSNENYNYSDHAAKQMSERNLSKKTVESVIKKGEKYYDSLHDTYAFWKSGIRVITDIAVKNIVTALKDTRGIKNKKRFIKSNK